MTATGGGRTGFDTVLVANRGEIAVRIIRTLRRMGLTSVAVHSDADAGARHVAEADVAVRLGPAPAAESYLHVERLLAAAERTGAGAVHPGYGFLAENAAFARAVAEAGLAFVGPPAEAIEVMGDKIRAKQAVAAAGVPVVPGGHGEDLLAVARELGMPVLLKPSAGGGGKGMRLVRDAARLPEEIEAARRTARSAFGDDTLLVERWVDRPRHIEVQVLADGAGRVLHLGERECSLQRRHQKIVEEAPSPLLDEATRAAMGRAAVRAAGACGYRGAGTVEFIVAGHGVGGEHYFMEMNTRLQVEHPVTELVTGLDLVEWQLRIAAGEELPFGQDEIACTGHAVEARVCAETARLTEADGERRVDFLPSTGPVLLVEEPAGEGVRVDSGIAAGTEVGAHYDPLLAKVVAHGPDRPTALRRLRAALGRTTVLGVETNTAFLRALLDHPRVRSGDLHTGLVDADAAELLPDGVPEEVYAAAALLRQAALEPTPGPDGWLDPFAVPSGWRLGGRPAPVPHRLRAAGAEPVTVWVAEGSVRIEHRSGSGSGSGAGSGSGEERGTPARLLSVGEREARLEYAGRVLRVTHAPVPGGRWLGMDGGAWRLLDHDPVVSRGGTAQPGAESLTAPMPGTVTVVKAAVGDAVAAGQSLLVVEAMKMEHPIVAPHAGTLTALEVAAGDTVAMDQVLAVVTPDPGEEP
ncbi:acetyl/propionyl/methylcrotonyl-CoA carboxylase subunit alpha [Streptomyces triticirhizae]|uniref:Biotin-dependent 3-methylcrotonyl-coenzyme A carboxylase alpha1 subunit n=1 Tax=Streptomyces triticirhizae TaxID=2483353 RepID=A0A3M2LRU0_9ACTN|nr:biotin carboxylase N-terminal domain-containing protein [Streptomyces triticirhizae]RMI40159.1 ATP-grasp domain-containing protein [Streptomyces triticirhizae]